LIDFSWHASLKLAEFEAGGNEDIFNKRFEYRLCDGWKRLLLIQDLLIQCGVLNKEEGYESSSVTGFKAERELNKTITELNPKSIVDNPKLLIRDFIPVIHRQNL